MDSKSVGPPLRDCEPNPFFFLFGFGRYRTTVDRLLGMKLVPSRRLVRRSVSYDFMNRQMVWHAFTVCLSIYTRVK
jgi:hypothetical protein